MKNVHCRTRSLILRKILLGVDPEFIQVLQREHAGAGVDVEFEIAQVQTDIGFGPVLPAEADPVVVVCDPFVGLRADPDRAEQFDRPVELGSFFKGGRTPVAALINVEGELCGRVFPDIGQVRVAEDQIEGLSGLRDRKASRRRTGLGLAGGSDGDAEEGERQKEARPGQL